MQFTWAVRDASESRFALWIGPRACRMLRLQTLETRSVSEGEPQFLYALAYALTPSGLRSTASARFETKPKPSNSAWNATTRRRLSGGVLLCSSGFDLNPASELGPRPEAFA